MTNDTSTGFWIPFTDTVADGKFTNIYTKESFDETLFEPGQPNGAGGVNQNCLEFFENAVYDFKCDAQLREAIQNLINNKN